MKFLALPRANTSISQHAFVAMMTASIAFLSLLPSAAVAQKSSAEAIEQYRSAVALQNQELYDLAAEEWEAFVKKHGNDQYVGNAQHYLGVCYFQTEKYAKADKAFDAAVSANTTRNPKGKVKLSTTLFLSLIHI